MSPSDGSRSEIKFEYEGGAVLQDLVKNSKDFLRQGKYEESKNETKKLEKKISKVENAQKKVLSEFTRTNKRINKKEKQGYEVSEARSIIEDGREALIDMDINRAYNLIEEARKALEKSLFLPFPLLEKNVSLKNVIRNDGGKVSFKFQIINRMDNPLGEILLNISTPPGFKDLPEKKLGVIRPKENRSVEAVLEPEQKIKRNRLADLIINNKIILTSNLDCAYKYPIYRVSIRNISKKPLKNIVLKPFTPESLESKERKKKVEWLEPSSTASVTFKLYPRTMKDEMLEEEEEEEAKVDEDQVKKEIREEEEFLSKGSNYLLLGEELEHSYSIFSQYFSEQDKAMVISTTIPYKISGEFGVSVDREELIWLSNVESKYFQVIHPTDIHEELTEEIEKFVEENEEGVIFIDKLERMVAENDFESTLEFLENVWETTASAEFTLLTHVNNKAFSEEELKRLKDTLRLYQVL